MGDDTDEPLQRRHGSTQLLTSSAASRSEARPLVLPPVTLPETGMLELHDARGRPIGRIVTQTDGPALVSPHHQLRVVFGRHTALIDAGERSLEVGGWRYHGGSLETASACLEAGGETLIVRPTRAGRLLVIPPASTELTLVPRAFEQRGAVLLMLRS